MLRLFRRAILSSMIFMLALVVPIFMSALAQGNFPAYAYSNGHNLVVVDASGASHTVTKFANDGDDPIDSITWSTDGKTIAFVANLTDANNNPVGTALFITDGKSQASQLADKVDPAFPVAFTPDGQIMFMEISASNAQVTDPGKASTDLYFVTPKPGAVPQLLQPLSFDAQFGDGFDPILALAQYKHETRHVEGNYLTLAPVPDGLIYTPSASGIGIKLFVANLELPVSKEMVRAAVSPDGKRVAGLKVLPGNNAIPNQILVATLSTDPRVNSVVKTVKTSQQPDQIAWGGPDTIYYTTIKNLGTIFEKDELRKLNGLINANGATPIEGMDNHQVTIRALNLTNGADTEVYASDQKPEAADNSYAIARLSFVNRKLYFISVPGISGWARQVLDGKIDVQTPAGLVQSDSLFPLMVYQLDPATKAITMVGTGLHQVMFSPVN